MIPSHHFPGLDSQREQAMLLLHHGYCRGLHLQTLELIYKDTFDETYICDGIYSRMQYLIKRLYAEYDTQLATTQKKKKP